MGSALGRLREMREDTALIPPPLPPSLGEGEPESLSLHPRPSSGEGRRGTSRGEGSPGRGSPDSAFPASAHVIAVRSAVLGETVLLAGAAADVELWLFERPRWRGCVVYRGAELAALAGRGADELRLVHTVKRAFGGEVTGE